MKPLASCRRFCRGPVPDPVRNKALEQKKNWSRMDYSLDSPLRAGYRMKSGKGLR